MASIGVCGVHPSVFSFVSLSLECCGSTNSLLPAFMYGSDIGALSHSINLSSDFSKVCGGRREKMGSVHWSSVRLNVQDEKECSLKFVFRRLGKEDDGEGEGGPENLMSRTSRLRLVLCSRTFESS